MNGVWVMGVGVGLPGEARSCSLKRDTLGGVGAAPQRPEMWNGCKHSDPVELSSGSRAEKGRLARPRAPVHMAEARGGDGAG